MKFTMVIALLIVALFAGAEMMAQTPDYAATTAAKYYSDSLKTVAPYTSANGTFRDSVSVTFTTAQNFGYYDVTAYSTATDTLFIDAITYDGVTYARRCLVNMGQATLTTARVDKMITGATPLTWIVLGGVEVQKFLFTSVGANAIWFTVVGHRGVPYY
jgi:hypothetical protein